MSTLTYIQCIHTKSTITYMHDVYTHIHTVHRYKVYSLIHNVYTHIHTVHKVSLQSHTCMTSTLTYIQCIHIKSTLTYIQCIHTALTNFVYCRLQP
jgi:hypothetical protein